MAIQSVVVVALILWCGTIAVIMTRYGLPDRWGWIAAHAVVVLGGILGLALALDWAGWLTAALFALLVAFPLALLDCTRVAAQRGQWKKATRLHACAVLLHPTPWARLGLRLRRALSSDGAAGYVAALRRIEATGSGKQKAFARLMLAHERRDWEALLVLARAQVVDFSEAKPREVRALGELGQLDAMVRTYEDAEKWLLPPSRQECRLFLAAFTGRVEAVRQLLEAGLSAMEDETKAYWMAVAQLRADRRDAVARAMLRRLGETGASDRVRRSARQQLQHLDLAGATAPARSQETERVVERLLQGSSQRLRRSRRPLVKASAKAHVRGVLLLGLIVLLALLQRYFR